MDILNITKVKKSDHLLPINSFAIQENYKLFAYFIVFP